MTNYRLYIAKHHDNYHIALSRQMVSRQTDCNEKVIRLALNTNDSLVGNIYVGQVVRVLPKLSCAFVDIGEHRTGILAFTDTLGKKHQGDKVLVQVTKDAIGDKGVKLSEYICLHSQHIVYKPLATSSLKLSQKLSKDQKTAIRQSLQPFITTQKLTGCFVVRTHSQSATDSQLIKQISTLHTLWQKIIATKQANYTKKIIKLHDELPPIFIDNLDKITHIISDDKILIDKLALHFCDIGYCHYTHATPLFDLAIIQNALVFARQKRFDIPQGGNIIIDKTEAMTVIDVNSQNAVHLSGFCVNKNAVAVIYDVLQLQNIGGIVVIDFIDMPKDKSDEFFDYIKAYFNDICDQIYTAPLGLILLTIPQKTVPL